MSVNQFGFGAITSKGRRSRFQVLRPEGHGEKLAEREGPAHTLRSGDMDRCALVQAEWRVSRRLAQ